MSDTPSPEEKEVLRNIHSRPKKYLEEWLDFPAHVHQVAFRMQDPPKDRPRSRYAFIKILEVLKIAEENMVVSEKFGYGVLIGENGDRFIIVWDAHTEYYNYQIWHIPDDKTLPLDFGDISIPGFQFPSSLPGTQLSSLDIIVSHEKKFLRNGSAPCCPAPIFTGAWSSAGEYQWQPALPRMRICESVT